MKRSNSSNESIDERGKDVHRDITQQHSRLEEAKQRRRREWKIKHDREREHERLKRKKILEYEMQRARDISKRRAMKENDNKTSSRNSSSENVSIKKTRTISSKSSARAEKSGTSGCSSSSAIFQGPKGIKICEKELHSIKVDIQRNLFGNASTSELNREIINPEEVVIIRRNGEGSKAIFEREEIQNTSKQFEEIEERRTVMTVESGNKGKRSESFRRRSPSNSLRHRSQRSSSSQRSKSRESRDSSCKSDKKIIRKSDRERFSDRNRRDSVEHHRPSSSSSYRYRSSRNRESPYREYRDYRREEQNFNRRSESRRSNREEGSSSSGKPRNHSSIRESRSRSRSRSRDRRFREEHVCQIATSYCIDQMPYPVYYGPRPMMVGPMMPIRSQVPIPRGRVVPGLRPPSLIGPPIRPFPPRFMPPNLFRLGPPSNHCQNCSHL